MVTEFQLMSASGKVLARGEIDGDIYRLFSNKNPTDSEEFDTLWELYAQCGGVAILPFLFEAPARTRQLNLIGDRK